MGELAESAEGEKQSSEADGKSEQQNEAKETILALCNIGQDPDEHRADTGAGNDTGEGARDKGSKGTFTTLIILEAVAYSGRWLQFEKSKKAQSPWPER